MKLRRPFLFIGFLAFLGIMFMHLTGLFNGIVGVTKKTTDFGCGCHGFENTQTHVQIIGPSAVAPGDTAEFRVIVTSDTLFYAAGTDIATYYGDLFPSPDDTLLRRDSNFKSMDYELTHKFPKLVQNDTVSWKFLYIAPNTPEVYDTIYANGNAVDLDSNSSDGDKWNYADNKVIHVTTTSILYNNGIAGDFKLNQNYPNPFNPTTNISFTIGKASNISLTVYDLNGKAVATLVNNQYYGLGDYSIAFDAAKFKLSSGVYFYKLSTGSNSEIKKMVLVK